ncbi:MAG: FAD-binding oxidoreductase [Planctomycetota bacterium]|nr:MAG: FAD-binding oxidoreductase [Planctomycetota bacterium]
MTTDVVSTPANEQELLSLVRAGMPLQAVGSGTKRHHGPAPSQDDATTVVLRKLNKITEYEPGDLVVTVQAGVKLSELQAELAKRNQWLPIDPPYADATIGGILATNSSGPRRFGYGTIRDHLLGTRSVGADGVATRSGGRVVKNVTGFDLHKLHVGAFGSLGLVTEASFKLRPRPEISAAFVFPCASVEEAHALCLRVYESKLRPVALEALDSRLKHIIDGAALAIVGVEGTRPVIDRHYRELRDMAPKLGVMENERAEPLWNALRKLPDALKDYVRVRLGAKPHELRRILPQEPLWISAGTGIARVDLEPTSDLHYTVKRIADKAASLGGYAVAESAPLGMANRDKLPWGPGDQPLMKAIRALRDPRRLLNPGRVTL